MKRLPGDAIGLQGLIISLTVLLCASAPPPAGCEEAVSPPPQSQAPEAPPPDAPPPSEGSAADVVKISAKKYEYTPNEITLKKGVPVTLQLTSQDRHHGFKIPRLKVRADIEPGQVTEVKIEPKKAGEYEFFCDVVCGAGHEGMHGTIKVVE